MKLKRGLLFLGVFCALLGVEYRGPGVDYSHKPHVRGDVDITAPGTEGQLPQSLPFGVVRNPYSPPRHVQIPIWISDGHIEPKLIELYVGQEVILDIYNKGAKNHSFTIGRDVIWKNGRPTGFATGLIESSGSLMTGGSVIMLPFAKEVDPESLKSAEEMGWLEGQPVGYDKTIFLLHRPWWNFEWKDHYILGPDFSIFPHAYIGELRITAGLLGAWEFACFSENGQHYLDGERGKIIVRPSK